MGRWKAIGQKGNTYPRDESTVFALTDGLYGLILQTGEIKRYDVQKNEWAYVGALSHDGCTIDALDVERIKDIASVGDFVYFLNELSEEVSLWQLKRSTGVCKMLTDTRFEQIERYTSETLLVRIDATLHVLDPLSFLLPISDGSFAYQTGKLACEGYQSDQEGFLYVVHQEPIVDAVSEEEQIIGLPWSIAFGVMDYDKAKWDSIGLPGPPQTVDELFALIDLRNERYAGQHPDQPLLGNGGFFDVRYGVWVAITEAYINAYAST